MSVVRDRLTFFAVMVAVCVAVVGYLQLANLYPTQGRDHQENAQDDVEQRGDTIKTEEAGHTGHQIDPEGIDSGDDPVGAGLNP